MSQFHQSRVLIAEDCMVSRLQIRHSIDGLGLREIVETETGLDAWNALQQGDFHCLILDWEMPGLTGMDLLQRIRQDEKLKALSVLMITAQANEKKMIQAIQLGLEGYIVKPMNGQIVQNKVIKILQDAHKTPNC